MLEGFEEGYAAVNGTLLHCIIGGEGEPLVLMDGYPRTLHGLHKILPVLAQRFRVIAVDYRGQGDSDKPKSGYDKKNMAKDIFELIGVLGYEKVNIAGCDMGAPVAYAFAANYPQATNKLAVWESMPAFEALNEHLNVMPKPGEPNATGHARWLPVGPDRRDRYRLHRSPDLADRSAHPPHSANPCGRQVCLVGGQ
jgi:pimeloyl-ACP methyl ester carboxylesterase